MLQWSDPALAGIGFGLSLLMLLGGLIAVPILVARMPADYFVRPGGAPERRAHPALRAFLRGVKNCAGALLVLAGVAMLVLPGQGLLTVFVGLTLLDFPGKRRVQRRLLHLPGVHRVVAAIRRRAGQPPLQLD